jgi:ABC-type dipeptide/oligopeptide/nickel transport system ATPase component
VQTRYSTLTTVVSFIYNVATSFTRRLTHAFPSSLNCFPDDYLWPDLTAKEHLELFAGLRGVNPAEQEEVVQKWLESVDLADVQFQYSSAYSGGMKRRLSVALATIGDRPLVILDEPTTGTPAFSMHSICDVVVFQFLTHPSLSCDADHRRYGPREVSTRCLSAVCTWLPGNLTICFFAL